MCGIAGYISKRPHDPQVLLNMVNEQIHRGPDSAGFYRSGNYALGMRRLSINDLSHGDQPLYNEDRSIVMVYNGEIYNYPALRKELESRGHRFLTGSDGEAICHLYEELGEDTFSRLDGMFAVALWSEAEKKLILARDIPGEKPLYFCQPAEGEIVFSSELKSILHYPGIDSSLDIQALWDFPTFLWIPEPQTVYKNINCLLPGHMLVVEGNKVSSHRYKNSFLDDVNNEYREYDTASLVRLTRHVVDQAITSRLLSDVPLGCFLSSGLDSSIVAAVARAHLPSLDTFTIAFEDLTDPYHGSADESTYAAEFARFLGTNHHTLYVKEEDFLADLHLFCRRGEQPFSVSSGLGILAVSRAAREAGIKVLLTGDGADEMFGGYSWYSYLEQCGHLANSPQGQESTIVSFQNFGLPLADRLQALAGYSSAKRAWAWHYYAAEEEKMALYNKDAFSDVRSSERHFSAFNPASTWEPLDYIRQDREFYFPFEMLRKADRMTMANSVEGRVPFAAPAVLAHVHRLNLSHFLNGDEKKWILREAYADLLPQHVRKRPKHGFNVPIDHWLKGKWNFLLEEAFSPASALTRFQLINDSSRATAMKMLHDDMRLNGHTLFSFIMLNLWLEETYGNNR